MNVQVGSGLGTDLDPIWSPCWDHFGTMLGEQMRSKKCFKNSVPPDATWPLLTCPEPPGQPPLFARYNLSISIEQLSDRLQLSVEDVEQLSIENVEQCSDMLQFSSCYNGQLNNFN